MKLKNMKISLQLDIGLAIILCFVILLGTFALYNAENLWRKTQEIHDHPLLVQRASGIIANDVLNIRMTMKEMIGETDEAIIQEDLKAINSYEAEAYRYFDVIYSAYLGPQRDVDQAYLAMVQWKPVRDETIRLMREGRYAEALARTKNTGPGGDQARQISNYLTAINNFADNKADQLYQDAQLQKNHYQWQFITLLGIILLMAGSIVIFLRKGILVPLQELTQATTAFQQGKLDTRSRFASTNEFGRLSDAFNLMTETVQREMQNREKLAAISSVMIKNNQFHQFCHSLLEIVLQNTGSQIGAVYLLDEQKNHFQHYESIGMKLGEYTVFSAAGREGEFGAVIASGQVQHLIDIPDDAQLVFSTVSGDFKPKEIITIPIVNSGEVVAVISIASLKSYSSTSVWLVNNMVNELSAHFNNILASRKVEKFSLNLQKANDELQQQAKELAMQTDELTEQNMEMEMQSRQLSEASQLKSSFLSNMSHELRTPLNSVIALASVLNRRLMGRVPDEEYSYLQIIERNGKNLLSLVNDILDLSRIEAGKEEVVLSQVNLPRLIEEVVEMIEPQAEKKGIALINRVSRDLPEIVSDGQKCRHILQNIIGNAVKFTDLGEVVITAAVEKNRMRILVRDSGCGIAQEHLAYIFDEFRQVDETAARKNGGTGLGLAIAQKYAQLLGGSITVESQLAKGSLFTIDLPLGGSKTMVLEEQVVWGSHGIKKPAVPANSSNRFAKCVLLVEDSEPAIIQTMDILSEQGYQVLVARSGKEALDQIEKTRPDGMILDLMMPEMDGFQVLRSIRSVERHSGIPVLILSAKHITKEELSFLKTNHVFQLIQKGDIDKKQLLDAVEKMVNFDDQPTARSAERISEIKPGSRPMILAVEDNPDNLITIKALLQEDFEISAATDGKSGVAQAMRQRPDLILMDISLPEMDGFQAFSAIRNCRGLQHIPIIALTARAMLGDRERILAYGFDGYVAKPINRSELVDAIRRSFHE